MKLITLDDAMSVFDDFTCGNLFEDDRHDLRCMLEEKVAEPKMGHWITVGEYIKCSECGRMTRTESPDAYNFCMGCGADMREGDTDG